jgi:hypothetical protein
MLQRSRATREQKSIHQNLPAGIGLKALAGIGQKNVLSSTMILVIWRIHLEVRSHGKPRPKAKATALRL